MAALAALALLVPPGVQARPLDLADPRFRDDLKFSDYPVAIYKGPVARPSFAGAQRKYAEYRTAIRQSVKAGPAFAGTIAVAYVHCGMDCALSFLTDLRTGRIYAPPAAVYEHAASRMVVRRASRLTMVQWRGEDEDHPTCVRAFFKWTGTRFVRLQQREVKGECREIAPPRLAL